MNNDEQKILETLDEILKENSVVKTINSVVLEAEKELNNLHIPSVTKTVPLKIFQNKLPEFINLCRVFILRANTKSKIERHTNSFQRTMTWKGSGETKILENNKWILAYKKSSDGNLAESMVICFTKYLAPAHFRR